LQATAEREAPAAELDVRLTGLRKRYGDVAAVDGIDLEIRRGEFFTLLGPSGSGKTTTLRVIAGFERPDDGTVELGGVDVSGRPPFDRDVNTVFQDYALFPHMSVGDNVGYGLVVRGVAPAERRSRVTVEYGLRVKRVGRAERRRRAEEALGVVQLAGYEQRRIGQLSGGQRQRVALARALVNRPRVLLLDEPLGALDLKLRQQLQIELKQLQQELGITFVYVTHDQEEALTMSDRIAVFNGGRIEQVGSPADVYEHPSTAFVAGFIGTSNVLDRDGRSFTVRPEKIRLLAADAGHGEPGTVRAAVYLGPITRYVVGLERGGELSVIQQNLETSSRDVREMEGRSVRLEWRPEAEFAIKEGKEA
jgi:putative spermidine/putrescine transport system ATP-binding protein